MSARTGAWVLFRARFAEEEYGARSRLINRRAWPATARRSSAAMLNIVQPEANSRLRSGQRRGVWAEGCEPCRGALSRCGKQVALRAAAETAVGIGVGSRRVEFAAGRVAGEQSCRMSSRSVPSVGDVAGRGAPFRPGVSGGRVLRLSPFRARATYGCCRRPFPRFEPGQRCQRHAEVCCEPVRDVDAYAGYEVFHVLFSYRYDPVVTAFERVFAVGDDDQCQPGIRAASPAIERLISLFSAAVERRGRLVEEKHVGCW